MKDLGADPALAKAEPVARLGPSGFDPGGWAILTDHNIAIRFQPDNFHNGRPLVVDFRVFEASLTTYWGNGKKETERWELDDCGESWTFDQWEDAFWTIRGGLKWDGCINWETNPECMVHGCSPRHIGLVSAIFQAIYSYGKRHMDLLGDEVPPMPANVLEIAPTDTRSAKT